MSQANDAGGAGDRETGARDRKIAILIAALAALLAIAETGGRNAQSATMMHTIDAANLWQSFQAKTIRQTSLRTAADLMDMDSTEAMPPSLVETRRKRVQTWRETIARFESEPETQEGRKELMARARAQEARRERSIASYRLFGLASTLFQIAIVLAAATIVSGALWLVYAGGALGAAGVMLGTLAWLAPTAIGI
jgi:hypothetical protein